MGTIVGAVAVLSLLAFVVYGWRMMRRSDWDKAIVLQGLIGQPVDLTISEGARNPLLVYEHVVFLRLQEGNLVVRDRDSDERVYPIEAIREIRQGDRVWGPW